MEFINVQEAVVKWDTSQRRVQKLVNKALSKACSVIPSEANKTTDPRKIRTKELIAYDDEP